MARSTKSKIGLKSDSRFCTDMERLLRWLDDIDDLLVVFRVHAAAAIAALLLLTGGAVMLGTLLLGQPPLLAAP